ncbi:MAG: NAD-dependent epimerase/dehydratase family protein [bacterium]
MYLEELKKCYENKKVLITGGLGFIGSNLAIRLVELNAEVTCVDNMLPRQGGNLFNVQDIRDKVKIDFSDIRNELSMRFLVKDKDFVFHLAGQVNHIESIRSPLKDLDINCTGTLVLLEACRNNSPDVKVIFSGTRGQYGPSAKLPVDEEHPMNPKGIYAITNMAAEKMILVYHEVNNIKGTCLRLTNTYGPRHQMMHDEYGVVNWFIRKSLDNETINVFGDGSIVRDYLYIDDAVDALLMVGASEQAYGQVFNIGGEISVSFIDLAKKIIEIAGTGSINFTEFTKERKELEPGDYIADITKVKYMVGWEPKVSLEDGLRRTIQFYSIHKHKYWGGNNA